MCYDLSIKLKSKNKDIIKTIQKSAQKSLQLFTSIEVEKISDNSYVIFIEPMGLYERDDYTIWFNMICREFDLSGFCLITSYEDNYLEERVSKNGFITMNKDKYYSKKGIEYFGKEYFKDLFEFGETEMVTVN